MDSFYTKYRKYILDVGLLIAIVVCLVGTCFIGVVIGETNARTSTERQEAQLIESYRETIATKDQLIANLSTSTAKVADAVVSVTASKEQSEGAAKVAAAKADQAIQSAQTAVKLAKETKAKTDAQTAADTKKLKELQ